MKIVFTQKQIKIILSISALLLIAVIFLLIKLYKDKISTNFFSTREQGGNYIFTNPLLDFELPEGYENSVVSSDKARNFVENIIKKENINHISVYFRDLNNGPWIGINEKEYFSPASMLKTPLLISLLKWSEKDPQVLEKKVVAEKRFFDEALEKNIKTGNDILLGDDYSFFELAKKMIKESDNIATAILYENIPKSYIEDVFTSIGVSFVENGEDKLVRVKDMAGFYRVLFNSSYLNRGNSEMALSILSDTSYSEGLSKGVPKDVVIAHKFGERSYLDFVPENKPINDGDVQIHDCGIIYYPSKPYILCVMTRGSDFKTQEESISKISKFFFNEVAN